jgi:outer membrane protein assembly factor BamB
MMNRFDRRLGITLSISMIFFTANAASAGDWPQFRGPGGTGVSPEANLPLRWSATQNVRWKVDLPGRGVSCPVVAGGRVYVTACTGYRQRRLHMLCFEASCGKKLWERQLAATGSTMCNPKTCMAGATPVTDGERVYALFASGDLACLDKSGDLVWYRSLAGDYPQITNQVGMAASPIVWRDLLFLPLENAGDSFAAALDKYTGRNIWRVPRARGIYWITPFLVEEGNSAEVIFQTDKDTTSYEPQTGKRLWSYGANSPSPVASPIFGKGMTFVAGQEFVALKRGPNGGTPAVVWKSSKLRPAYASPLYHQGYVYVLTQAGILACAQATTGKVLWQERLKNGSYWASPVAAGGNIYAVSEEGSISVVQAGEQPKILSTNEIAETILATPAIADGAIFLRSDQHLICIGNRDS